VLTDGEAAILAAVGRLTHVIERLVGLIETSPGVAGGRARAAAAERCAGGRFTSKTQRAGPAKPADAQRAGTDGGEAGGVLDPTSSLVPSLVFEPLGDSLPLRNNKQSVSESFRRFWKEYPRKVARHDAWLVWRRLALDPSGVEAAIEGVRREKRTEWKNRDMEHIPHATTWLNQRRWEDDREGPTVTEKAPNFVLEKMDAARLDWERENAGGTDVEGAQ
jgi:hypothetical protein